MSIALARIWTEDAEKKYREYHANEGSENYNSARAEYLLEDSIIYNSKLKALENTEAEFYHSLTDEAKKEMDRICAETDEYISSTRKAG